ncbi:MAG: DNA cytosine methyltransferase, partial [Armatimonadetes bacterium]|nr:DNA cytosine methyltransferase [Armatimonadota bacterium]
MTRPVLLDLFCGQGGAAMGYHRAGFDVVGVDLEPQPRYPFRFIQADALEFLAEHGRGFEAIHASPPCQRYSRATGNHRHEKHPDLVGVTRDLILGTGFPYIIENVPQAPLRSPVQLCGLMFPALRVIRHRDFESNLVLFAPAHPTHLGIKIGRDGFCCVVGHGDQSGTRTGLTPAERAAVRTSAAWARAMG